MSGAKKGKKVTSAKRRFGLPVAEGKPISVARSKRKLPAEKPLDLRGLALRKSNARTLSTRFKLVSEVLNRVAEATERAERLDRPVRLNIRIVPSKAEPEITSVPVGNEVLADALAAARKRGEQYVAALMRDPDMLPGREFAALIGLSPETVNQRRKAGELLGLEGAKRGVRFPRWQVTGDGRPLPELKSIFEILDNDPWAVFRFLRQSHSELAGKTALEELKAGHVEEVRNAARNARDGAFA